MASWFPFDTSDLKAASEINFRKKEINVKKNILLNISIGATQIRWKLWRQQEQLEFGFHC